eukprot:TRINITY_DN379_c0_g1_i1.p1 TRINITY_DN379_c0_g1~~TRINITY_DN379_c0_g1_i1.p1  ORF type:complete len:115 (+),score=40.28 TRINITY_DN379_c0_g1_i1:95-439(+)
MSEAAKQLKIKTGTCKRLAKELNSYVKETTQQRAKVESLKASGSDEHAIKKQEELLQENFAVIPDVRTRLQRSIDDLNTFIKQHPEESEEKTAAVAVLQEAVAALEAQKDLALH